MEKTWPEKVLEFALDNLFDIITILITAGLITKYTIKPPTQTDIPEITTWILAMLGLIAVTGLWDRNRRLHRIEELSEESRNLTLRYLSGKPRADDFFQTERQLSDQTFASASEIFFSGVTLTRTTREYMYILGQRLEAGAHVRIMIADPELDSVLQELELRDGDLTAEQYHTRLQAVEMVIDIIANTPDSTGTLEIGYLPNVPTFGLIFVDPDQPHGTCWVEIYHHRTTEPTANFELRPSDDTFWYNFFRRQYEILWQTCRIEKLPKDEKHATNQ